MTYTNCCENVIAFSVLFAKLSPAALTFSLAFFCFFANNTIKARATLVYIFIKKSKLLAKYKNKTKEFYLED